MKALLALALVLAVLPHAAGEACAPTRAACVHEAYAGEPGCVSAARGETHAHVQTADATLLAGGERSCSSKGGDASTFLVLTTATARYALVWNSSSEGVRRVMLDATGPVLVDLDWQQHGDCRIFLEARRDPLTLALDSLPCPAPPPASPGVPWGELLPQDTPSPTGADRASTGNQDRLGGPCMHLETPVMNLRGFSHMTHILAFCSKENLSGGAHRIR